MGVTRAGVGAAAVLVAVFSFPDCAPAQEWGGPHLELPQVLERGDGGPALLLIHCAGCGARSWDAFMEANEDRFRMIAVTLPGYAGSPRPDLPLWTGEPVFQENAVYQLAKLLDEREMEDVTVMGHSFGASIALDVHQRRRDRIRAVVNLDGNLLNPVSRADEPMAERVANARRVVDEDWAIRLQDPDQWYGFNAGTGLPTMESRLRHHGMFMASDRVSMVHYWRENFLVDQNPAFRALEVPYLDVRALRPWDETPDSTLAAYRASVQEVGTPDGYTEVVLPNTTHWVHVERPRLLGDILLDLLAGRDIEVPELEATVQR